MMLKFVPVTVLLVTLLALPHLSYAENGAGGDPKPVEGSVAEEPAYSDANIDAYLSTLEERSKIENPVVKHFAFVRITGVLAALFVGFIYVYRKYKKLNSRN